MKAILMIGFILIGFIGFSQQIVKESIDSGGGSASATGLKTVATIGEVVVAEKSNATLLVSEGFIGPGFFGTVDVSDYQALEGLTVYPNPTTDMLFLRFSEENTGEILVFDVSGKEVIRKKIDHVRDYQLSLSGLTAATYMVLIKNTVDKRFKAYKIVKK